MVKHEFSCNLCAEFRESGEMTGLSWYHDDTLRRLAMRETPVHQTEIHVCRHCLEDLYKIRSKSYRFSSEEIEPGDHRKAFMAVAYMIRDAARKARDSKLAKDDEELDRLIGLFNLPEDQMFFAVTQEWESPRGK